MCLASDPALVCIRFSLRFLFSIFMCRANLEFCPLPFISLICSLNIILNVCPVCPR
jgi:hypothetical protein